MKDKINNFFDKLGTYMLIVLVAVILIALWYNYLYPIQAGKYMFYEDYYNKHK